MQGFKNIIRMIKKNAVFLLVLIGVLLALSQTAVRIVKEDGDLLLEGNKSIAGIQGEPEDSIDVLVLGDSESYTTVSPMDLWKEHGFTSYVCGKPGQRIEESYYTLKTAFKTQKPKLVLMETNVIYRYKGKKGSLQTLLREARSFYFPIFRFHDFWKPLLTGNKYQQKWYKGFGIRDGVKPYVGGSYMDRTKEKKKIEEWNLFYMDQIIRMCEKNGAQLVLYSGPSPVNYNYRKHNGLAEFAEQRGLEYIDLNMKLLDLGIDWKTDTSDKGDHLNISGAKKVTRYMGDYLMRNYRLEDRRGNQSYKRWNEEADRYEKETQKSLKKIRNRKE